MGILWYFMKKNVGITKIFVLNIDLWTSLNIFLVNNENLLNNWTLCYGFDNINFISSCEIYLLIYDNNMELIYISMDLNKCKKYFCIKKILINYM